MRLLLPLLIALPLTHSACSHRDAAGSTNSTNANASVDGNTGTQMSKHANSKERAPLVLDHDFGVVPHGEGRTHEFALDLSQLNEPHVPLRVHLECSCGRAELVMRKPDGTERHIDGTGYKHNLPTEDEQAILRILLDTRKKEARDIGSTISRGYIVLQPLGDETGMARERWAFVVRFAIDSPVTLHPFSELDFQSVSQSMQGEILTTMRGDENHPNLEFLSVSTTDESLEATLEPDEGRTVLRTRCTPGRFGNHRGLVLVKTNLPGYVIALEAKWKVVADLEATPMRKVSFRAAFDRAQKPGVEIRQAVLVIDHNRHRSPEFLVRGIVGDDGRDVSHCFEIKMTPVPTEDRRQRMTVRYLGGLLTGDEAAAQAPVTFRGKIILAKHEKDIVGGDDPTLPIRLVVFPSKTP
jgi:hypothetical protein